ncbi:GTPase-activating gyp7 [Lecanosticta acicola]|uniref:GTPase-activating protein GYP7 n=1 Tax=Lecanosticta acicola TaxID=111012 RepID=A0AAI9EFL6_9PEZI|nr:GTPase-activating gyp7 [Lecanosticta acicola]
MPSTPPAVASSADPPSPPSPSASFYDMSDEDETEYSTVRHSHAKKGVKLLYAKSKVYVHPSPSAKDNVAGFIGLQQQRPEESEPPTSPGSSGGGNKLRSRSDLLLAWLPESGLGEAGEKYTKVETATTDADGPPKQSYLVPRPPVVTTHSSSLGTYAFAIPVSDIFSILVRPPSTGWWFGSIIVNSRAGDSFPPLFFHDSECQSTIAQRKRLQRENFSIEGKEGGMFWGGDQVIEWLKRYVTVERSAQDSSVYLINPSDADRIGFGSGGKPTPEKVRNVLEGKPKDQPSSSKNRQSGSNQQQQVLDVLKQARFNFMEKMAQVTTFTRRTAQAVAENKNLPPQVRRLMQNPQVQTVSDEFDSARLYLARWAMGIAEQSERERNQRIWTAKDILEIEDSELGQFELLDADMQGVNLAEKRKPVTLKEWEGFFNEHTGKLEKTPDEVKERVFHGGLSDDDGARKEAWLFLLGVYEWDSTKEERHAKMNSLRDEYIRLKGAWWERMVDETGTLEEREWWKEQKMRIEKDVHRTDRHLPLFAGEDIPHPDPDSPFAEAGTNVHLEQMKDMLLTYNEYNRDLGYVQGMSDLLAPIYAVEQDDAVAFWGFTKFMERMERNFLRDQSGMRLQLLTLDQLVQLLDPKLYEHLEKLDSTNFFFFFRMLLVWYKREFDFEAILRLWEGLWTDYLSANFHLFIAAAILEKHREVIMEHLKGFDEVLKYVNELSGTIDLYSTMVRAESLFRKFRRMVEAIDRKSNFPAVPVARQRLPQPPSPSASQPGSDGRPNRASSSSGTGSGGQSSNSSAHASGREQRPGERTRAGSGVEKERVITPELRQLLSRDVPKLDKAEVQAHGGGVGS